MRNLQRMRQFVRLGPGSGVVLHDDDPALFRIGEQLRIPRADALRMHVVGAHAEHNGIETREVCRLHVLVGENFHVGADLAQAFRNGVARAWDITNQRRLVLDFRPNEFRLGRRNEGLRLDVRIRNSLTAERLRPFARVGNENGAQSLLRRRLAGGVSWKVQLVSLSVPSSFTGMETGSTFQPAGTSRASVAAEFFRRRDDAHVDRLRLLLCQKQRPGAATGRKLAGR